MFESSQDEEAELDQLKKDAARTARDRESQKETKLLKVANN